jgi:xylulokinase
VYLGIDLGTSAVKVVLVDDAQQIIAESNAPLKVSRPHPGWSEQAPDDWWKAAEFAIDRIHAMAALQLAKLRGIGLSGQMHGATLLDAADQPLRPAILWNDGRSVSECEELERRVPASREITGNLAMPGFTAPKLLWVRKHEPDHFASLRRVLLPKDYLRLRLTGDHASDLSDSSGTLWLDVAERRWSDAMLAACELDVTAMPSLVEGNEATGCLRAELAQRWGCERVPVAGGGGDQAAGALGAGVVMPGQAARSLGTSGVLFVAGDRFRPNPAGAVHAFCHCVPDTWHQMSVILSAASCLSWVSKLTGASSEQALLEEVEAAARPCDRALFLPYLSGERTPHNDPTALGVFFGLDHDTTRATLGRAVLEGVAFAFADGMRALETAGARVDEVSVIGGGARSRLWGEILASALDRPLLYREGGERGPAHGAARLARLCSGGESVEEVCPAPAVSRESRPEPTLRDHYRDRHARYRELYQSLGPAFASAATPTSGDTT